MCFYSIFTLKTWKSIEDDISNIIIFKLLYVNVWFEQKHTWMLNVMVSIHYTKNNTFVLHDKMKVLPIETDILQI